MRATVAGLFLLLMVSVPIAYANDVDYKLQITDASEFAEPEVEKPFTTVVKDRMWVAKGIEERIVDAKPPVFAAARPVTTSEWYTAQNAGIPTWSEDYEINEQAPEWIDDDLWPRTKELLRYGSMARPKPAPPEVTWAGLQR